MKENIKATNFDPNEYAIFVQSTKIGTYENKVIHSTYLYFVYWNCYQDMQTVIDIPWATWKKIAETAEVAICILWHRDWNLIFPCWWNQFHR